MNVELNYQHAEPFSGCVMKLKRTAQDMHKGDSERP
jgi:hypothetical protein